MDTWIQTILATEIATTLTRQFVDKKGAATGIGFRFPYLHKNLWEYPRNPDTRRNDHTHGSPANQLVSQLIHRQEM